MKKTILSLLLIGSSCALFAQVEQNRPDSTRVDSTNMGNNNMNTTDSVPNNNMNNTNISTTTGDTSITNETLRTTGAYSAYGAVVSVPTNIQTSFQQANPTAGDVRWEQNNEFYRASYSVGARRMKTFYDTRGNSFSLALPVTQSLVPDDVIERAYQLHGDNIYDIVRLQGATDSLDIYQVRVIENAIVRAEKMHADGSAVMPEELINPFGRKDSAQQDMNNMNQNMNNWNNNATDSLNNMNNNMTDSLNNNMNQQTTDSTIQNNSQNLDDGTNTPDNPDQDTNTDSTTNQDAMKPENKDDEQQQ